jgi:ergothioneine biosynthesis protein EgtB
MTYNPPTFASIDLLPDYQQIRKQTEHICAPLQTEDYTVQPITDVSPPKWHLGHTTWFFENFVLIPQLDQYQPFNLDLNYFFNSYYESQGPRILRSNRGNMTRPSVEEVMAYRAYVDRHMQNFLEGQQKLSDDLHHLITVGLQHEQQHQELLITDIKYILGDNPLHPAYREHDAELPKAPAAHFLTFAEGLYEIGYQGTDFCWDNEQNLHKVYLNNFAMQSRLVTNGEYLEFMQAGGYDQHEYWLMEGFEWAKSLGSKSPQYWYEQDGQWYYYTMQGLRPLDLDAPVTHVSYYEADAYAQWKGLRLPTEFEWEVACQSLYQEIPQDGNFQESGLFMPTPAQSEADYQFLGQVWEWTASAYLPYPGYPRFKGALGEYNGKFMVNQMVLRGGSCATPVSHIRSTYRNFFHPDKRWQFTGIRLAK